MAQVAARFRSGNATVSRPGHRGSGCPRRVSQIASPGKQFAPDPRNHGPTNRNPQTMSHPRPAGHLRQPAPAVAAPCRRPRPRHPRHPRHTPAAAALCALALAGVTVAPAPAPAAISCEPGYAAHAWHSHPDPAHNVISFDWDDAGTVYYLTDDGAWGFGGLHAFGGGVQTTFSGITADFAGASVIRVRDYVYFNTSDYSNTQRIWKLGPLAGSPAATAVSTAPNNGLYSRAGDLFLTGAPGFGTSHVYQTSLDAAGNLAADPPADLGETIGASGPLAFDPAGNLYYAPGYGATQVYRWTAAEVAAAIADPLHQPLPAAASRLWHDYTAEFAVVGATGMDIDADGHLLLSLTGFGNPSLLVRLRVDDAGNHAGNEPILTSTGRLGDVRVRDGRVFFSDGATIYQLVPEPSAAALAPAALGWLATRRRRPANHCDRRR